jgi:glycosyltransferase involved in cell wall biosynthesis
VKIQVVSWRDPLNPKAGGAEVCLQEIAKRLIGHFGHSVSWFAPAFENGSAADELDGVHIQRRGTFAAVHLQVLRRFLGERRQIADFYVEDYHGLTLGMSWYLRKPHLVFVHEVAGPIWFEMWKFPLSWVGYGLEKLSLKRLDRAHFIAVSASTRQDLIDHGVDPAKIFTVTEGSDIARVDSPRPRASRSQQFLFVGRICRMKRVDLLLQAFAKHLALCPRSRLVLAGSVDEQFRPELDGLIREHSMAGSVEIAGRVSQERKAELLQTSLALVSCSMREGFGLVVVEANSQGTPAVTFDVNGYRDLVERDVNGFLVEFGDLDAMARTMRDLVEMEATRYDDLCSSSLDRSMRYSWDQTAFDVNRIIEQLAGRENGT